MYFGKREHLVAPISASHHDGFLFCGAVFILCYGLWSLVSGSTLLFHRTVKRSEDALQYWMGVLIAFTSGILLMIAVIIDWHQRTTGR